MTGRHRTLVAGLLLLGVLSGLLLILFGATNCPAEVPGQPCPQAPRNVAIVVGLTGLTAGLLTAPFAFLAEVLARRRIVYRGAWGRAARRGTLVGLTLTTLAGLRLGGVLSVPILIFVVVLAGVAEWLLARRDPW